jgi:hypothetical protein
LSPGTGIASCPPANGFPVWKSPDPPAGAFPFEPAWCCAYVAPGVRWNGHANELPLSATGSLNAAASSPPI